METIKKQFRFFVNFEKEEAWLNDMSQKGWHLQRISTFYMYTFVKGDPENRNYRIDCRALSKYELADYLTLFSDSGWVSIDPKLYRYNYYFYSENTDGKQDIFSDKTSKAKRYLRLSQVFLSSGIATLIPYISINISNYKINQIGYQTPNLWTMPVEKLTKALLIETPFVIFRVLIYCMPILMLLLFVYFVIRFYVQYKKDMKALD